MHAVVFYRRNRSEAPELSQTVSRAPLERALQRRVQSNSTEKCAAVEALGPSEHLHQTVVHRLGGTCK